MNDLVPLAWSAEAHKRRFEEYLNSRKEKWLLQFKLSKYSMIMDLVYHYETVYGKNVCTLKSVRSLYPIALEAYPNLKFSTYFHYIQTFTYESTIENGIEKFRLQRSSMVHEKVERNGEMIIKSWKIWRIVAASESTFEWLYDRHTCGPNGGCTTNAFLENEIKRCKVIISNSVVRAFFKTCFVCRESSWNQFRLDHREEAAVMEPRKPAPKKAALFSASYPVSTLHWILSHPKPPITASDTNDQNSSSSITLDDVPKPTPLEKPVKREDVKVVEIMKATPPLPPTPLAPQVRLMSGGVSVGCTSEREDQKKLHSELKVVSVVPKPLPSGTIRITARRPTCVSFPVVCIIKDNGECVEDADAMLELRRKRTTAAAAEVITPRGPESQTASTSLTTITDENRNTPFVPKSAPTAITVVGPVKRKLPACEKPIRQAPKPSSRATIDEVVALNNSTSHGLSGALFTQDRDYVIN